MTTFWSIFETICIGTAAIGILCSWFLGWPKPDNEILWLLAIYAVLQQQKQRGK